MINIEAADGPTRRPPAPRWGGNPSGAGGLLAAVGSALPTRDRGKGGGRTRRGLSVCHPGGGEKHMAEFNSKWQTVVKALAS